MAGFFTHLLTWTADNDMQINTSKTKEMILGRINPADIPLLSTPVGSVERVTNFKLLGVHLYHGQPTLTTLLQKQAKGYTS